MSRQLYLTVRGGLVVLCWPASLDARELPRPVAEYTYPMGAPRQQHLYLYHVPTKRIVPIGHFDSPAEYNGEWRCDTHPRVSRDGTKVVFDSPCGGNGRQMYLIDIGAITGGANP